LVEDTHFASLALASGARDCPGRGGSGEAELTLSLCGRALLQSRVQIICLRQMSALRQKRTFPTRQLLAVVMPIAGLAGSAAQIPAGTLMTPARPSMDWYSPPPSSLRRHV
jgi:hypothetical protein